jgi:hypothetical protein
MLVHATKLFRRGQSETHRADKKISEREKKLCERSAGEQANTRLARLHYHTVASDEIEPNNRVEKAPPQRIAAAAEWSRAMSNQVVRHEVHLKRYVGVWSDGSPDRPQSHEILALPVGASSLLAAPGGASRLADNGQKEADSFIIEPVFIEHRPQAILISPPGRRARVGGQISPPTTLIREGDTVLLDDEHLFTVLVYQRVPVGNCTAEYVGKECPICRVPFGAEDLLYFCACGAPALHWKSAPPAGEEPLTCAQDLTECQSCLQAIVKKDGYASQGELQ